MQDVRFVATSTFGLEKIVKQEIMRLGYSVLTTENGSITFNAPLEAVAKLNLNLRCAERLYLEVGQFEAFSFEDLFQGIKAIPWDLYLEEDSIFPVNAKSIKSTLYSLSDIQAISKKAIVEKLKSVYESQWFQETGYEVDINVHIFQDRVQVLLDTSGEGLHKRGYRAQGNEAPLKETLAAGLVLLSNWYGDTTLIDPMCGTGTLLIEAAMLKKNIAPGLNRRFASEDWGFIPSDVYPEARRIATEAIIKDKKFDIRGYDIHGKTIAIARKNAEFAGVSDCITFETQDINDWDTEGEYVKVIINPPYGERLEDADKAFALYEVLGQKINAHKTWSSFVITSHEGFEKAFGVKATKNRKLYNGKIKCYYYQYIGPKQPRTEFSQ